MSLRNDKPRRKRRRMWLVTPRPLKRWPYGWCLLCGLRFWPNLMSHILYDDVSGVAIPYRGGRWLPFPCGPFLSDVGKDKPQARSWRRLYNIDVHYLGCFRGRSIDTGQERKTPVPSADGPSD